MTEFFDLFLPPFIQLVVSIVGSIAFSLLFGVPKKYYLWCGLIGGTGWLFYYILCVQFCVLNPTVGTLFATMIVAFLSRVIAVVNRCPVTVFLITGIFPLVPGAGIYWTVFYLVNNQFNQAVTQGFNAAKATIAIVLGIVLIFEIPNKVFHKNATENH